MTGDTADTDREFSHDPVWCEDCGELVVVTRNADARTADDDPRFECACSTGSIGAMNPESWVGGDFL